MDDDKKNENGSRAIRVIIETPRGSLNKYAWNEELNLMELKDNLPLGCHFPYDFGFIPDTLAEDGDPLDIMVLSDTHTFPGIVICCKVIGIIKAEQKGRSGKIVENDRVVAVSLQSPLFCGLKSIRDIDKDVVRQLLQFFIFYERQLGKHWKPTEIAGPKTAMKAIESSIKDKKVKSIADTPFQQKAAK